MKKTASPHSHERRFIGSRREDGLAVLLEEEAHHLQHVLRLSVGAAIVCVLPEEKTAYHASITSLSNGEVLCSLSQTATSSSDNIVSHVIVATTKPAINELIVEKLSELGVENIFFYKADRSLEHDISDNKKERLIKIALTATKQCGRASVTSIQSFNSLKSAESALPQKITKVWASLAHPECTPHKIPQAQDHYAMVIGPAGDFSPEEETYLADKQWHPMYLGNIRLREETAAIAGVCALHTLSLL